MGFIQTPYRVIYESRNFVHGLTNIQAIVVKPNNVLAGPFPLVEFAAPLSGRYYFDYITSASDPEGEYFCAIYAANDSMNQTTQRISLYKKPADIDLTVLEAELEALNGLLGSLASSLVPPGIYSSLDGSIINGLVQPSREIQGYVLKEDQVTDIISTESISASSGEEDLAYSVESVDDIRYNITSKEII